MQLFQNFVLLKKSFLNRHSILPLRRANMGLNWMEELIVGQTPKLIQIRTRNARTNDKKPRFQLLEFHPHHVSEPESSPYTWKSLPQCHSSYYYHIASLLFLWRPEEKETKWSKPDTLWWGRYKSFRRLQLSMESATSFLSLCQELIVFFGRFSPRLGFVFHEFVIFEIRKPCIGNNWWS